MMLKVNDEAIDFVLPDHDGREVRLSDFKGKTIVLYFYPRDSTPGCTKEACAFRDVYDEILGRGGVVIGISKDSVASHAKFRSRHDLPFHLLSDLDGRVVEAYGAWGEKTMMGRRYMGILRCTYLIGQDFRVRRVFDKVKPEAHGREILDLL